MVRVFYSESDWLWCPKCGAATEEIVKPNGFDAETGRPRVRHFRKCQKARWWNSAPGSIVPDSEMHLGRTEIHYIGPRPAPARPIRDKPIIGAG